MKNTCNRCSRPGCWTLLYPVRIPRGEQYYGLKAESSIYSCGVHLHHNTAALKTAYVTVVKTEDNRNA